MVSLEVCRAEYILKEKPRLAETCIVPAFSQSSPLTTKLPEPPHPPQHCVLEMYMLDYWFQRTFSDHPGVHFIMCAYLQPQIFAIFSLLPKH